MDWSVAPSHASRRIAEAKASGKTALPEGTPARRKSRSHKNVGIDILYISAVG